MSNIIIEIRMPDFIKAAEILAGAIGILQSCKPAIPAKEVPTQDPITTTAMQVPTKAPDNPPTVSEKLEPIAPTAPPTTFSVEDIQVAIAPLMPMKQKELKGLLEKFGVVGLTQLTEEQRGAFTQEIRAIGAKI